ncbi:MAG: hypothetical protein JXR76_27240 [Deltaproteobacteria bacterium]|nr:hypothetical protein [Deltaproteobacteria bacterium]
MERDRDGLYIQIEDERYYWLAPGEYNWVKNGTTDGYGIVDYHFMHASGAYPKRVFTRLLDDSQTYMRACIGRILDFTWYLNAAFKDDFGIYRDFMICGVIQRFRWIPRGEFMMGSPASEHIRRSNELQHPVELTKGSWLADTACTQELWDAVMGDSPSEFKGKQRPVEKVRWYDCTTFIGRINTENPGLKLSFGPRSG